MDNHYQELPVSITGNDEKERESKPLDLEYYRKLYANPLTGEVSLLSEIVQDHWLLMKLNG
jgi:hypothetical protein